MASPRPSGGARREENESPRREPIRRGIRLASETGLRRRSRPTGCEGQRLRVFLGCARRQSAQEKKESPRQEPIRRGIRLASETGLRRRSRPTGCVDQRSARFSRPCSSAERAGKKESPRRERIRRGVRLASETGLQCRAVRWKIDGMRGSALNALFAAVLIGGARRDHQRHDHHADQPADHQPCQKKQNTQCAHLPFP